MIRKLVTTATGAALAAAGLLLPAAPARAQQGWPLLGDRWGYYGGGRSSFGGSGYSSGYSRGYYAPGPQYSFPSTAYSFASPVYYPPLGSAPGVSYAAPASSPYLTAAEVENPRAAQVHVRLPAGAEIWFNDTRMPQTGAVRHFVSPPLDSDEDYSYQVKVRWREGGRTVTRTRTVEVHAGDRLNLAFGPSAAGGARR
jgi:uncharacterized protein (TIGR03000 family)